MDKNGIQKYENGLQRNILPSMQKCMHKNYDSYKS